MLLPAPNLNRPTHNRQMDFVHLVDAKRSGSLASATFKIADSSTNAVQRIAVKSGESSQLPGAISVDLHFTVLGIKPNPEDASQLITAIQMKDGTTHYLTVGQVVYRNASSAAWRIRRMPTTF